MKYLIAILFFIPCLAQADIFQWIDKQGEKHFSDRPQQGAKRLKVNAGYAYYSIKKIYDGDTILLTNGQKVRFLGINTPEVEGRNKLAQAGGEEARQWLQKKLKNKKVRLERDVEKKDKYGRLLAHVFTPDNAHLNFELVKLGLATVNIHPPNLKYMDDLLAAESEAEQKLIGIWQYQQYAAKAVESLNGQALRGWQRVFGTIKSVYHSRKYSYLNLTDTFSLKIQHKSSQLFPELEGYVGSKVEVRGWINKHKKRYSMFIRHPSSIKIK